MDVVFCGQCKKPCNDCCTVVVSLRQEEADRLNDGNIAMHPSADGFCKYNDRETKLCTIYNNRPHACRNYNCVKAD